MLIAKLEYENVTIQNEKIKLLASLDARVFILTASVLPESVKFTFADVIGIQYFFPSSNPTVADSDTDPKQDASLANGAFFDFKLSVALKVLDCQPAQSLTILRLFCISEADASSMAVLLDMIVPGRTHRLLKPLPYGKYEFSASRVPGEPIDSQRVSSKRKPSNATNATITDDNFLAGLALMPSLRYQLARNSSHASPGTPGQSHTPRDLSSPDIFSPSMRGTTNKLPRYDLRARTPRQYASKTASPEAFVSLVDPEFDDLPIMYKKPAA
jgi:hypothetical protein